ncbi:SUKH-4 family immunity protein [Streptomyces flavidovirens]|uniref:SUKH-4 family immunity protein n=1 Tax=Streptomyces flavidovirens TaxID=67298 RepID=UPI0033ACD9F1
MAELTGPSGSGRTQTLFRLREAVPGAVFVDATGLTSEDLIERVMEAAGLDVPHERRADWGYALRNSSFSGGLVIIANAQRAGRTRRSSEPDRMVHRFTVELAVAGRLKVLIERDVPDTRRSHSNVVVTLRPSTGAKAAKAVEQRLSQMDADALRALALAEVRRTPLVVWTALARALGSHTGRPIDVAATLQSASELLEVDATGRVSFRDEVVAEALRRTTAPDVVRAVNLEFVEWLRSQPVAEPAGWYMARGLAMHAVQADQFDSVQRSGRLVAHLDQVALIDAAHCHDRYRVDPDSPAGDAVNLWMSGVDSLPQGEWASWLHLMSTMRGDLETAADIAACGQQLPWRVRWAHWRPPGALSTAFVRPGPLGDPIIAPEDYCPGRRAVIAQGQWDQRYRAWDAETGEELAGPWPDAVPAPGQRETLWLPDTERDVTPTWDDLTVFDSLGPPFVSEQVALGDLVVVTGLGGIFAVEPQDSAAAPELSRVHGEPIFEDHGFVPALHSRMPHPRGAYDADLFEPGVVRRLPTHRLPEGVTDAEARRVLTDIGLPAFEGVEMQIAALDEQGLPEIDMADLPAGALPGAYYKIGVWVTSDMVLHGPTGQVLLLDADAWSNTEDDFDDYFDDESGDEDDGEVPGSKAVLIASSLAAFIDLLQYYVMGRCMLAASGSRLERVAVRDDLADTLPDLDPAGTTAGIWTAAFQATD